MRMKRIESIAALVVLAAAFASDWASASEKGDFHRASSAYQASLQKAASAEAAFFRDASRRLREAYDVYKKQWEDWYGKPDAPPDIFYDLSGYKKLYAEAHDIGKSQGDAAIALAQASDCADTAKLLWKQLASVLDRLARAEKDLREARVMFDDYHIDQQITLRRTGLEPHFRGLVEAIGRLSDGQAQAFLAGKAWDEACQGDKKNGDLRRRMALEEAFGRSASDAAFSFLKARMSEQSMLLRSVALEGIGGSKEKRAREVLDAAIAAATDEKAFSIRVAAMRIIEAMKAPASVGPLIEVLRTEVEGRGGGILCGHIIRILKDLTGKDYGVSWENWKGWFEKHREEVEKGLKPKDGDADPGPGAGKHEKTISFYDIPTFSKGIIIIIDASDTLVIPADLDISKKHSIFYWLEASKKKLDQYKSQMDVLKEEASKAIESMDDHTFFNVILLHKDNRIEAAWPAVMPATAENKKKALKMFMDTRPGGWAPQFEGLLEAFRIAGMDPYASEFDVPAADTFYLLTDGGICGGRYMTPASIIDAVKRINRFRNATIHTIQIADLGMDAVDLLRGLAEATGGSYVWRKK